jgi:hypothetical protein
MKKLLCCVVLMFLISGCIHKPFQPVPDEWELWEKSRVVIQNDIERAMLECGHPMGVGALSSREEIRRNFSELLSESARIDRCMEKDGFRYTGEMGTTCSRHPDTPECKLPIEQIPSRDINRRLNGVYCTKFPTAELCKP